jgi:hypothetical protein
MAGIGDYIQDLLAKLETDTNLKYVRVFNNQFTQIENGTVESFPMPCAFVEIVAPNSYDQLSIGYTISDLITRVHIGMVEYDAQDGTFEQNLSIFALRDSIISLLQNYQPVGAGKMMKIAEAQDYEHTNVYHYTIDFKCSFVDDAGRTDKDLIEKEPPTDLEVNAEFDKTYLHKP